MTKAHAKHRYSRYAIVFGNSIQLAVGMNSSKTTYLPRYNKLLQRADGPYRTISVQHQKMTMEENGVLNTKTINRAALAPSYNTNANVCSGRTATGCERTVIENKYQTPDAKSQRAYSVTPTRQKHTQRLWQAKSSTPTNGAIRKDRDLKNGDDDIRKYAVERILGHKQRNKENASRRKMVQLYG